MELGIANRMGKLRHVDEEVVKLNLMPSDVGVVTAKGYGLRVIL